MTFTKWDVIRLQRVGKYSNFQSNESFMQTVRNLKKEKKEKNISKTQFVDKFVKRVRETGMLVDKLISAYTSSA